MLARAIYDESCKSAAAGIAPQDMRKGVQMGVDHVVARLKERAKMISTPEEIAQVPADSRCNAADALPSHYGSCHGLASGREPALAAVGDGAARACQSGINAHGVTPYMHG